ncbi:3-ketoacyl-CoA thiolase [Lactarius pseudohatsudake]|nr:3-ketoacyl-CoA thiolase [Lactarius pseudohatsudake]
MVDCCTGPSTPSTSQALGKNADEVIVYVSRAAALAAGIPDSVPISTVNRLCSSGLMAIRDIAHSIQAGEISLGVAVGVESMSLNPRPTPVVSDVVGANAQARDCIQVPWGGHQRWSLRRRGAVVSVDDTVRPNVSAEGLAALKPSFPEWGDASTTAGNASGVAALCILTTRARAEAGGFDILAKFVGTAIVGVEPRHPIHAIPKVLNQIGLNYEDIDINEAFASQFAHCVEQLKIPIDKINPNGGSIALTHPLGMTGVRQVVTGLEELRRRDGELLCTSMCVGSGLGAAGIFVNERQSI